MNELATIPPGVEIGISDFTRELVAKGISRGPVEVLKCVYETRRVAILKGRKVYRLSDEVDFDRVLVVTVDFDGKSYGPAYFALPNKPPEVNVTRSVVSEALTDTVQVC